MRTIATGPEDSLAGLLGARARAATAGRLVLDIVGGTAVAGTVLWARPRGWVVWLSAALCFAAYGAWAVAERRLAAEPLTYSAEDRHRGWRVLREGAAFIGIAAFLALLFSLLAVGLGRWIS